ncbi:MAG: hypothetical protein HY552_04390 [Elusimicrobia bacterium]|nr:hypothetical protein [Elusimicrobiota bacterium]
MNPRPRPFAALAFAVLAAPAAALVSGGVDQTFGSHGYRGTSAHASLDLGDAWYAVPSYSNAQSDAVAGVYHRYGLRVGYERGPLSLGVQGDVLPKVDGYQRASAGADLTVSLLSGGSAHQHKMAGPGAAGGNRSMGSGLTGVDAGVSGVYVRHQDDALGVAGASGSGLNRTGARRAAPFKADEGDFSVFAGARLLLAEVSAQATKSVYSKTLDGNQLRQAPYLALAGFGPAAQGYPDAAFSARVKWTLLPLIHPYASYAHTTFKLGQRPSDGYEAGVAVGLRLADVKAGWQRYVQSGFPTRDTASVGASLNF